MLVKERIRLVFMLCRGLFAMIQPYQIKVNTILNLQSRVVQALISRREKCEALILASFLRTPKSFFHQVFTFRRSGRALYPTSPIIFQPIPNIPQSIPSSFCITPFAFTWSTVAESVGIRTFILGMSRLKSTFFRCSKCLLTHFTLFVLI